MQHPDIEIIRSEEVYSGFNRIKKYFFAFPGFNGKNKFTIEKEVFERKDASAVLLYDPRLESVVLIEQFRPGCFLAEGVAYPLEIPAGLIDEDNADPSDIAKKEAFEETGCRIEKIIKIGHFFPEVSFSSRRIHLFCGKVDASQLQLNGGIGEEGEDIRISLVTVDDLKAKLDAGGFINSHTLIAVQWFFLNGTKLHDAFILNDEHSYL